MTSIVVTVPGNPVPYARAQTGAMFGGKKGRYHDPRVREYLERVRVHCMQATARALRAGLAWPREGARYEVLVLVVRENHRVADIDNLLKSALDGATGPTGLWLNDADVQDARVVRCEPSKSEPRLVIVARTLTGGLSKAEDFAPWGWT